MDSSERSFERDPREEKMAALMELARPDKFVKDTGALNIRTKEGEAAARHLEPRPRIASPP